MYSLSAGGRLAGPGHGGLHNIRPGGDPLRLLPGQDTPGARPGQNERIRSLKSSILGTLLGKIEQ